MKRGIIVLIIVVALAVTGVYVVSSRDADNSTQPSFVSEIATPEPTVEPPVVPTAEPTVEPTPEPTEEVPEESAEETPAEPVVDSEDTEPVTFYDYMDPTPGEITVDDVRVFYNTYLRDEVESYGVDPDYFDAGAYSYWDSDDRASYCHSLPDNRTFMLVVTFKDGRIVDYYLDIDFMAG